MEVAVLSMGNPHAVQRVADIDAAPVATLGPAIETHPRFPRKVNAGFMQVVTRRQILLRVWERGAGETWPAAPAPAPRWSPASGSAGSIRRSTCTRTAACSRIEWAGASGESSRMCS